MFHLLVFSILFKFSIANAACPTDRVVPKNKVFSIVSTINGGLIECTTSSEDLKLPIKVEGCFPPGSLSYLVIRPQNTLASSCFKNGPANMFIVKAEEFQKEFLSSPQEIGGCDEEEQRLNLSRDLIGILVNDLNAAQNSIKSVNDIEKYNSCIAGKQNRDLYNQSIRYYFERASTAFGVPISIMSCLCGRESAFNPQASNGNARGLCQALKGNLQDINRWIRIPEINRMWKNYLERNSVSKKCKADVLTQEKIMECPNLAIGAAAIYLNYGYSRIAGNGSMIDNVWKSQSISSMVAIAASYNVGVGTIMKVVERTTNREKWASELLNQTCEDFSLGQFNETKGHIIAIRNCLVDGSWLNHQGKPMNGNCAFSNKEKMNYQMALSNKFEDSLPVKCEK